MKNLRINLWQTSEGGWGEGGGGGERRETRRTRKKGNCHLCFFFHASLPSPFPKHGNSTEINNKHTYQVSVVKSTGSLFTSSGAKGKKSRQNCLSLLNHGYCIVGLLTLAKICLLARFTYRKTRDFQKLV